MDGDGDADKCTVVDVHNSVTFLDPMSKHN